MARLIVNPGSTEAWEIELQPGVHTLGRDAENTVQIAHDSVSDCHCEIVVETDGCRIKDLGSTNGTFLDHEPIGEATLRSGQTVNLGDVEMVFYTDGPRPAPTAAALAIPPPPIPVRITPVAMPSVAPGQAPERCKFHPKVASRFYCPKCQHAFCELCVNSRAVGGVQHKFCRTCGTECAAVQGRPRVMVTAQESFARLLPAAFLYPFNGDGVFLLVTGTACYCLINVVAFFSKFALGFGAVAMLLLTIIAGGYFTCYLRRILTSSAMGEAKMPDWPDLADFGSDILGPLFQLLIVSLASFLPSILCAVFLDTETDLGAVSYWVASAWGCAYFPMAFLAVAMFDSVLAVNPMLVIPSMVKVWKEYFLLGILFGVVMVLRWAAGWTAHSLLPPNLISRLLGAVFSGFLGLYILTVEVHILGLLYRSKKATLGWFRSL
jgi:hypothetical protein